MKTVVILNSNEVEFLLFFHNVAELKQKEKEALIMEALEEAESEACPPYCTLI